MAHSRYLVPGALIVAMLMLRGSAFAQSNDFALGPGGKIKLTADNYPNSHDSCGVIYSLKIPVTLDLSSNILAGLSSTSNEEVQLFVGNAGELCTDSSWLFMAQFPDSVLKSSKTALTQTVKFSSKAACGFDVMPAKLVRKFPILFNLQFKRKNGKGMFTAQGIAQKSNDNLPPIDPSPAAAPGMSAAVDVMLLIQIPEGNTSDPEQSCVTVPVTYEKPPDVP